MSSGLATHMLQRRTRNLGHRGFGSFLTRMQLRRSIISPYSSSSPVLSTVRLCSGSARTGKRFLSWYTKQLDEYPLATKIVSSALIAASGDLICQILENNFLEVVDDDDQNAHKTQEPTELTDDQQRRREHAVVETQDFDEGKKFNDIIDWYRTGRFLLIGAFWVAPVTHLWYGFLSTRLIPGAVTPMRVVQRLFLDQFGAAPVFCPAFMGLLWLLEGKPISVVKSDLIEAGPTLVMSNWILWIPAMGFMFSVVPLKFQVVYSNFVGLVWTVYLSYASTRVSSQSSVKK